MAWEINADEHVVLAGSTRVELFFVFDDPARKRFFDPFGVWIEALRFIFKEAKLDGTQKIMDGMSKVTKCCFDLKTNRYEIKKGKANFGGISNTFKLAGYMKSAPRKTIDETESGDEDLVNCYDQAYSLIVFSGALGVTMGGVFLAPFGFLKKTKLVGRGTCNNPFPRGKFTTELKNYNDQRLVLGILGKPQNVKLPKLVDFLLVDPKDPDRAGFGNHMFCEYRESGSYIYDACAGPSLGVHDRTGYMLESIDANTPGNVPGFPKTIQDIKDNAINKAKIFDITNVASGGRIHNLEVREVK